jgi:hypothetical protein
MAISMADADCAELVYNRADFGAGLVKVSVRWQRKE